MTAQITPLYNQTPLALPERPATIIPIHVETDPVTAKPNLLDIARTRLETFLDHEGSSLARLFSLLDLPGAEVDIEALNALLKEHQDPEQVLMAAEELLDRLVEDLAEIPLHAEIQRRMRAGEEDVRDLDAMVRWLGARVEEIRNLLRRALV